MRASGNVAYGELREIDGKLENQAGNLQLGAIGGRIDAETTEGDIDSIPGALLDNLRC